jgi:hypothetical protein
MLAALEAASVFCGPTPREILSSSREARIVRARHLIMYALVRSGRRSTSAIGAFFNRDHSSVLHAARSMKYHMQKDLSLAPVVLKISEAAEKAFPFVSEGFILHDRSYRGVEHVPVYELALSPTLKRWLKSAAAETPAGWLLDVNATARRLAPRDLLPVLRVEGGRHRYLLVRLERRHG